MPQTPARRFTVHIRHIAAGKCRCAGLLATQGIRDGANREVLKCIKESRGIFGAESDRPWVLNGANIHVSMVGFDDGSEEKCTLDGQPVASIGPDLSGISGLTTACTLPTNLNISFLGSCKGGPFDITDTEASEMLACSANPHMPQFRPLL